MPTVGSLDKKMRAYRRGPPSADWSTFLTRLADPTVEYVRAPAGVHDVGIGINIGTSNKVVDCRDCIFTVTDPTYQPFVISSTGVATLANEKQCQGLIDETTDRVTVLDPVFLATISVGDYHILRLGVQSFDPQEPNYSCLREVIAIEDDVVVYDRAFGYACPTWDSEAELEADTIYDDRVGPWGVFSGTGYFQRGLGLDHGIRTIDNLVTDVLVRDLTLKYDGNEIMYGAWGILIGTSRRVRLEQSQIINPHGSAVHLFFGNDTVIDGLSITGTGRGAPFGGATKTNIAVAISSWSSFNCNFRNVQLNGVDCDLFNFESGNRQMIFDGCGVDETFLPGFPASPTIGSYGPGDVVINDLTIDISQPTNSRLFPAYLNEVDLNRLTIATEAFPDSFLWEGRGNYDGVFTWAGRRFSAPEVVVTDFTAIPQNIPIPYPEGIIMTCTFTILSRDGFQSFSIGGDPFQNNPGALVFSKTDVENQIPAGETYSAYRTRLAGHRIYRVSGSGNAPVSMSTRMMRLI